MDAFNTPRYFLFHTLIVFTIVLCPLKISSSLFNVSSDVSETVLKCYFDCVVDNCTGFLSYPYVPFPECTFAGLSNQAAIGGVIVVGSMGIVISGWMTGYFINLFKEKYRKKITHTTESIDERTPLFINS